LEARADEPPTPPLDPAEPLPAALRAELKGLPAALAEAVAAHLVAAGQLVDSDPDLAWRHAEAAKRRAARLPSVREVAGETAYAAGQYAAALAEFRALKRLTGTSEFTPVMVDCLRALGKYREALDLAEESRAAVRDPSMQVELRIVEAGVRSDMGQTAEARRLLRQLVSRPPAQAGRPALARAFYAYAAAEAVAGDEEAARGAFERAAELDDAGETAALDRLDALDGFSLDLDEAAFFDASDSADGPPEEPEEDGAGEDPAAESSMAATAADGDVVSADEGRGGEGGADGEDAGEDLVAEPSAAGAGADEDAVFADNGRDGEGGADHG
jgi:tetratricopeptide (TPR) repeat protein